MAMTPEQMAIELESIRLKKEQEQFEEAQLHINNEKEKKKKAAMAARNKNNASAFDPSEQLSKTQKAMDSLFAIPNSENDSSQKKGIMSGMLDVIRPFLQLFVQLLTGVPLLSKMFRPVGAPMTEEDLISDPEARLFNDYNKKLASHLKSDKDTLPELNETWFKAGNDSKAKQLAFDALIKKLIASGLAKEANALMNERTKQLSKEFERALTLSGAALDTELEHVSKKIGISKEMSQKMLVALEQFKRLEKLSPENTFQYAAERNELHHGFVKLQQQEEEFSKVNNAIKEDRITGSALHAATMKARLAKSEAITNPSDIVKLDSFKQAAQTLREAQEARLRAIQTLSELGGAEQLTDLEKSLNKTRETFPSEIDHYMDTATKKVSKVLVSHSPRRHIQDEINELDQKLEDIRETNTALTQEVETLIGHGIISPNARQKQEIFEKQTKIKSNNLEISKIEKQRQEKFHELNHLNSPETTQAEEFALLSTNDRNKFLNDAARELSTLRNPSTGKIDTTASDFKNKITTATEDHLKAALREVAAKPSA